MNSALGNCYNISPEDEGYLGDIFRSWNEAKQYYEDALVIRRKREDVWEQVPVLNNLSQVCQRLNEIEDAQQYGQQALEISQEVGNLSGQVSAILNLGDLCQMEKKPQSIQHAFNYYQQAWEASRKVDYLEGKSRSAVRLGDLCLEQSHHKEALACFLCARLMSDSLARVVQRKIDVLRKSVNEQAFKELQADIEPVTCQMTEHIFMKGLQNLEVM
jgi:tetratricopeptide (TPR) repeat protein